MIYGYTRVSTDRQAQSGLGLEAQRSRIMEYVRGQIGPRTKVTLHVERGVSASAVPFARRAEGHAIDIAAVAGDHIVIAKLDRGFRSIADCAAMLDRWHRRGIIVHLLDIGVATHTPSGRLIIGIMATIAEWEARRIGERIREALAALRAKGICSGLPPLGYRVRSRRLVADVRMQRVIGLIYRMRHHRRQPPVTYRMIADYLTAHRSPGSPWTWRRCWRAAQAPEAPSWAKGVSLPRDWTPPTGYRHSRGKRKREARAKVPAARRRYIAHLGQSKRGGT